MSDCGDDEEYEYHDEDKYEWQGDEDEDDGEIEAIAPTSNVGLKFEGKLIEHLKVPAKGALYSIYRQLSEICVVDVSESFFSALLTIRCRDQFTLVQLDFPTQEPLFPTAPPSISLQTTFKPPNDRFNVIFSCHPQLLNRRWNICTDIVQIIRDIIEASKISVVDMVDEDPKSIMSRIIELLRTNCIDISGLFPNDQFTNLPSFGIIREVAQSEANRKYKGTGYSSGGYYGTEKSTWNFSNYQMTKLDHMFSLAMDVTESYEAGKTHLIWVIDTIYYVCNEVISQTITLDEFFRNLALYEKIIRSLYRLPKPSGEHIPLCVGLVRLHEALDAQSAQFLDTLEVNEREVIHVLRLLNERFESPVAKKSKLGGSPMAEGKASAGEATNGAAQAPSREERKAQIIELESPFEYHKYMSDMRSTTSVNAKWLRRLRIELSSMPDTLPYNVIVFTGINVSQPNLMKIMMFPESEDTPYCGGCFEFDVFIPADYPNTSPKVNLITTGYGSVRFNPNLYNCGKVCLSLLGTWSGEPWNPNVSSLSQVVNSILFLIFIEEPYFNEPGYQNSQGTPIGTQQSINYNKVIRMGTLQYAYADHFKCYKKKGNSIYQFKEHVIPMLRENWLCKGRKVALKWAEEHDREKIFGIVEQVDAAVAECRL